MTKFLLLALLMLLPALAGADEPIIFSREQIVIIPKEEAEAKPVPAPADKDKTEDKKNDDKKGEDKKAEDKKPDEKKPDADVAVARLAAGRPFRSRCTRRPTSTSRA